MNYYEAMGLLNRVKDGENIPMHIINAALYLSGDIDGHDDQFHSGWQANWQGAAKVCSQGCFCTNLHTQGNDELGRGDQGSIEGSNG